MDMTGSMLQGGSQPQLQGTQGNSTQLPSLNDHANTLMQTALSLPPDHPMVQTLANTATQLAQAHAESQTPPDGYAVRATDGKMYIAPTPELAAQFKEQYGMGTLNPANPNYKGAGGSQATQTQQPAQGLSWGQDINNFVNELPQAAETTVANATQIPQLAVAATDLGAAFGSPNDQARTQKMNQPRDLSKLGLGVISPDSSFLGGAQQGFAVAGTVMSAGDLASTVKGGVGDAASAVKGFFSSGKAVTDIGSEAGEAGVSGFNKVYEAATGAKSGISTQLGNTLTALDTSAPEEVATLSSEQADKLNALRESKTWKLPESLNQEPKFNGTFQGVPVNVENLATIGNNAETIANEAGGITLNHTQANDLLVSLNDAAYSGSGDVRAQDILREIKPQIIDQLGGKEGAFAQARTDYGEGANTIRGLGKISDLTSRSTPAQLRAASDEIVKMFKTPLDAAQTKAAISDFADLTENMGTRIDLTDEYNQIVSGKQISQAKAGILGKIGKWTDTHPYKTLIIGYLLDKAAQKLGQPNIPLP